MMKLTVGADPEFFVRRGVHYISGHVFDCGTKREPLKTDHGHVQVDGIALEANVTPAATKDEFVYRVRSVMSDLSDIVKHKDADLVVRPSIFFGRKKLSEIPIENAHLGCTADWDAYTGHVNPRPDHSLPIRTGAGHIHLGWGENITPHSHKHMHACYEIVQQLDYYLGLPSLLWDKDSRRRKLYGKAGAFRPKEYGVEYRVLSNAWITTDKHIGWVFDRTVAAFADLMAGKSMFKMYGNVAKDAINEGNVSWPDRYRAIADEVLVT